jgi:hypothetical protein
MAKPKDNGSGGVDPKDLPKPKAPVVLGPDGQPLYEVPYGSYDPSIDAQRRAAERGLADLRFDTRIANAWAGRDLSQSLADIGRKWGRGRFDINRSSRREGLKLDFREFDLGRDAKRGRQDFASRLASIGRDYANLGDRQRQSRNAAGTFYGGTAAAAAAKRATNQSLAEQPVRTAAGRMEEDLATNLGRIGVSRTQLGQDTNTALTRGRQDTTRDRKLTKQSTARGRFDRYHKLQRGTREQQIGDADLMQQAIYNARQNRPGAFNKYGKKK